MAEPSPRPSAAEELPAPPWPATALRGPWGLEVGGLALTELADRFGTPLLVVDEQEVRDRARAIAGRFPRVLYAVKAFTAHAVLRIVLDEGLDLLASTGGEVEACLRAGAPASRIVLHGNNKTDEELALAVGSGVSLVVVDHRAELERLDAVARSQGRVQPVLLRVVPEVEVATHEAIATGHDASKFGMALADAPGVIEAAASMTGIRFDGIHAHVGSQVLDLEPYLRSLDRLVQTLAEIRDRAGVTAAVLDLGGGFGVTYVDERPLATDALAVAVTDRLAERCSALDLPVPSLIVEPGRSIVANAGLTALPGGLTQAGGERADAVGGGRRHVRQRPAHAVRRALHRGRRATPCRRRPRDLHHRGTALRVRGHPRRGRATCPPTPGPATCSRSRRRAPTPTRWRAATTASVVPRWSGCATASRGSGSAGRMPPTSTGSKVRRHGRPPSPRRPRASRSGPPLHGTPIPTSPSGPPWWRRAGTCAPSA